MFTDDLTTLFSGQKVGIVGQIGYFSEPLALCFAQIHTIV